VARAAPLLAPSLLSADFADLAGAIRAVEEGGAGALHLDVMDGHFVPNITFGPDLVRAVRARTRLPLDIHLMITDPLRYAEDFIRAGGDTIAFHVESPVDVHATIERIRSLGARPGLAVRPDTPFETFEAYLPSLDEVMVMTVQPGFSGQRFLPEVLPKMRRVHQALEELGRPVTLGVDGGVSRETIGLAARAGAGLFVCGSSVFGTDRTPQQALRVLQAAYQGAMVDAVP
jgi:ribulose-phosphate 3-epimerase